MLSGAIAAVVEIRSVVVVVVVAVAVSLVVAAGHCC